MAYEKLFCADTLEEALRKAEEYKETLDPWTQPHIHQKYDRDDEWCVSLIWYGLD